MSVLMTGYVFKRYPCGGGELLLALALADHAADDGTRIYPSVKHLAAKTRQSERTVQYQLRKMRNSGWLVLVADENGGRGKTRQYRINPNWIKGADFAPFNVEKGATAIAQKGATAIAPEPSLTINNKYYGKNGSESVSTDPPFFEIMELWNEIVAPHGVPAVRDLTDSRKRLMRARWSDDPERQFIEYWRGLFDYISASDFLTGRSRNDGKPFASLGFDWVFTLGNFVKIIEGNYENRR